MTTRAYDRQGTSLRRGRSERLPKSRALGGRWWWLIIPLIAVALTGLGLSATRPSDELVEDLAEGHLVGPRSPAPIHVVFIVDWSGSFAEYAKLRQQALDQVLRWAPENLRGDDTVSIIAFAGDAVTTLPATTVADVAQGNYQIAAQAPDPHDTHILPALEAAVSLYSGGATSLIVLTDTLVDDATPEAVNPLIAGLNVTTMSVITPTGVDISQPWQVSFPWEAAFEAGSGDVRQTAVAVGNALAHATGQRLEK